MYSDIYLSKSLTIVLKNFIERVLAIKHLITAYVLQSTILRNNLFEYFLGKNIVDTEACSPSATI